MESKPNTRLCGMLGFAMRAGKLILGTELICAELSRRRDRIKLVLVSDSASLQTKKKLANKCGFYGKNISGMGIDTEELGRMLGKSSPIAAVAVLDDGFSREISSALSCVSEGNSVVDEDDEASNRKEASK